MIYISVTAIKIRGKNYVEKGEQIILTCNATGELYPPEDIDWFKDGSKIKPNQFKGVSIAKFRIAETKTLHSQLEIDHSSMDDSGNYIGRSSELAITDKSVIVLNGTYSIFVWLSTNLHVIKHTYTFFSISLKIWLFVKNPVQGGLV